MTCSKRSTILMTAISTALVTSGPPSTTLAGDLPAIAEKPLTAARPAVSADQAVRALAASVETAAEAYQSYGEFDRGPAQEIYSKVAPATVLISTGGGYGTGFFVSNDGWILTNYHVIEGAPVHLSTGSQAATVYMGHMATSGLMEVDASGKLALVHKVSATQDLALLKLSPPAGIVENLPFLRLSDDSSVLGRECAVVGHPRAGMLWTVRSGEVAGIGRWPQDRIDNVLTRLAISGGNRPALATTLQAAVSRKVLTSTCGINPGDSGSALVDNQGEVIGVTFAIPRNAQNDGISLDKFSFHVHLDEVRAFLEERPQTPPVHVPDAWPAALLSSLRDNNGNDKADTWVFGVKENERMTGMLLDLDEDSPAFFKDEFLHDPAKRERWEFEFAFQTRPLVRTFYDCDNDGNLDIVFTDVNNDHIVDVAIRNNGDGWNLVETRKQALFDPSMFRTPMLQERFRELIQNK